MRETQESLEQKETARERQEGEWRKERGTPSGPACISIQKKEKCLVSLFAPSNTILINKSLAQGNAIVIKADANIWEHVN